MSEYAGTDRMKALQQSLRERRAEFDANPLLANGGRIMNILDPDQYGWANVKDAAYQDGIVVLSMVDREETLPRLRSMFGSDVDFPYWQSFTGARHDVMAACSAVTADIEMPKGWRVASHPRPDDDTIHSAQVLNEMCGVAPAPAYYLRGEDVPSMLTCIYDAQGSMAACASASMRYHPEGPLAGWLFAGGVSVHPDHRRRGLGALVNASMLTDSQTQYNWTCALAQAKADNAASVGMIMRCGLRQNAKKITVAINLSDGHVTR
ncbi:MAG: GNAT family N-acetyltransferase [Rhizobiaceae bacterium]